MTTRAIPMPGCRRDPLIHYLKSLGVVKLLGEQLDEDARSSWRDGSLVMHTTASEQEIETFFIEEYRPSPILVPWSGSHFFGFKPTAAPVHRSTPTGSDALSAFCDPSLPPKTQSRLEDISNAISEILRVMAEEGIEKKSDIESTSAAKKRLKATFLIKLRDQLCPSMVGWIDTAALLDTDKVNFSAMLGSGGGSDGNANFGDNFLQNLWDVLPDFDPQRAPVRNKAVTAKPANTELISNALFATPTSELVKNRTSGLFDAGGVGGPNATQGFEGNSATNPWDFILAMEGGIAFAGAISRKGNVNGPRLTTFPFQVASTSTGDNSLGDSESVGREFWLPLWDRRATWPEVSQLLAEGRLQIKGRQARSGEEAARAVAELGVSRGIDSFVRYGAMKGRIGGDNYFTTLYLEQFEVRANRKATLLRQIDPWVESYRRACSGNGPQRFRTALRRYDRAVMEFCRTSEGGSESTERFRDICFQLGTMHREVAGSESFRQKSKGEIAVRPFPSLGGDWLEAVAEESAAFSLALSLGGLSASQIKTANGDPKVGRFRTHLEPCTTSKYPRWGKESASQTWRHRDIVRNLSATAERRFLDSRRLLEKSDVLTAFDSYRYASLDSVTAFLHGLADLERFENFLWPLSTVWLDRNEGANWRFFRPKIELPVRAVVPRSYAILKLSLVPPNAAKALGLERLRPEPKLFPLLRTGKVDEACRLAHRRLRLAATGEEGWTLMPRRNRHGIERTISFSSAGEMNTDRLAASLLFPLSEFDFLRLKRMVFAMPDDPISQQMTPTHHQTAT